MGCRRLLPQARERLPGHGDGLMGEAVVAGQEQQIVGIAKGDDAALVGLAQFRERFVERVQGEIAQQRRK